MFPVGDTKIGGELVVTMMMTTRQLTNILPVGKTEIGGDYDDD